MEDYQCLVIGISRYQFFPLLSYGEVDAKAIYQFLLEEVKIPQQQILLISDTSPPFKGLSTYPNQDNLKNWLNLSDQGWLIFNGYGLNYQGEDYLMPIDGNPQNIPQTAISLRSLILSLEQAKKRPKLLILNLYSLGIGTRVGQQIMTLAKQKGIALIFSLRPADERITRSKSAFTTAVLEALHYYGTGITLTQLAQYLGDRLPSLNVSQGRVVASPVVISPSLAFSSQSLLSFPQTQGVGTRDSEVGTRDSETELPLLTSAAVATVVNPSQEEEIPQTPPSPRQASNFIKISRPGKWFWLGGVFALLFLIFLIFLVKVILFMPASDPPDFSPSSSSDDPTTESDPQQELLNRAITYLKENQASSFNRAINEVRKIPSSSPVYPQAKEKIASWSEVILDIAQGRAKQENFQDAIAAARLVPPDQEQVYSLALEAIETWQVLAKQQQVNRALIEGAKALIKPFSASSYNQGITILSQIAEGESGYREAQELINQWSQNIYLIANSRAAQGNYQQAIITAQLVPEGTSAYDMASRAIAEWKTKQNLQPSR